MSYEYLIAKRYLTQKKETGFITIITYLSIVGLSIGVAALIITLGVINGFESTIKEKIINFQAHITLETFHQKGVPNASVEMEKVASYREIKAFSPYIEKECFLRFGRVIDGAMIRGIDPEKIQGVTDINLFLTSGEFDLSKNINGLKGIIIGSDLVEKFGLAIGDEVFIANLTETGSGISASPDYENFELRGIFESGMSNFDNLYAFIHINDAQDFFRMADQISGMDIRLHDVEKADMMSNKLQDELGYPFYSRTWYSQNLTLFSWINVQKLPILIAFGMIILVGSINLVSTLILIVLEKQKDIGILKSFGATSKSVMQIFFIDGLIIGITASIIGSGLALILGWLQNNYQIISMSKEVYYIGEITVELVANNFYFISSVAIILCVIATIYPAWKAAKLLPSEAVRS